MLKQEHKALLPYDVYAQIEEICKSVHEIQTQAVGILQHGKVPDSAAQLNDVLQTTENATMKIIDTVTAIQMAVDEGGPQADVSKKVSDLVTSIYEACSFQDISGQMIKKVLGNLTALESKLTKLSETAKAYGVMPPEQKAAPASDDALMSGPQLSSEAPTQADIDKLFGSN